MISENENQDFIEANNLIEEWKTNSNITKSRIKTMDKVDELTSILIKEENIAHFLFDLEIENIADRPRMPKNPLISMKARQLAAERNSINKYIQINAETKKRKEEIDLKKLKDKQRFNIFIYRLERKIYIEHIKMEEELKMQKSKAILLKQVTLDKIIDKHVISDSNENKPNELQIVNKENNNDIILEKEETIKVSDKIRETFIAKKLQIFSIKIQLKIKKV